MSKEYLEEAWRESRSWDGDLHETKCFQEAIERLEKAEAKLVVREARDVVTPEYLQNWIKRANEAEAKLADISVFLYHKKMTDYDLRENLKAILEDKP